MIVICNFHQLLPPHSKSKDELESNSEIYPLPTAFCRLTSEL
jgi:hypothetical protein